MKRLRRFHMPESRAARWGLMVLNLAIFFGIWQYVAAHGIINPLFFPKPTDIVTAMKDGFSDGTLGTALWWSMRYFAIGMIAAAVVGIPVGLLMGASPAAYALLSPYVWAMSSLPRVAITPLLILILGFSAWAELTLIFLSALFPIIINCMAGPKTVDSSLLRAGRVFGANRFEMYLRVVFPYTLPFIVAGLNQGLTRGLVGMVIAEIFGGNNGLGYVIQRAGEQFDSPLLYAALMLLVIVSLTLVQVLRVLEARVAPWRSQAVEA
ncbi:ABC transporter permease [Conexibacter sp. CPCC 206217]|uniref:ABC transporter permease n=1 Tax=Conexibacter sp. CPCC 206217 TaxID=3064574 RepID=UPI00271D864C|nr:ABC transporter permease [Conexibacter sp. CPCC 206217]MDO8213595.1 ABC transporter permease [Conexibacter sp. CPCC 206217]